MKIFYYQTTPTIGGRNSASFNSLFNLLALPTLILLTSTLFSIAGCGPSSNGKTVSINSTEKTSLGKDQRIAIIGGGVAGLSAAYRLNQKGYTNVVVFEKSNRVGGKVSTFFYDGLAYETGAIVVSPHFTDFIKLAREVGIEIKGYPGEFSYFENGDHMSHKQFLNSEFSQWEILTSMVSTYFYSLRHPEIARNGFKDIPEELTLPMNAFLLENPSLVPLARLLEPGFVTFGYGYYNQIPAIYYLKEMHSTVLSMFAEGPETGAYFYFPEGYSTLMQRLASYSDVKTATPVTKVSRNDKGIIKVTTNNETTEFDKLIIATPLDTAVSYLDTSNEEKELFEMIHYYNYYTLVFRASGLPKETISLATNTKPDFVDNLMMFGNPYKDNDVYIAYMQVSVGTSDDKVLHNFIKGVENLGGKVEKSLKLSQWSYFPHVSSSAMKSGYFEKLGSLQGKRNTYYVGSVLGHEFVPTTAAYSINLIDREF